jgi:hypothetical protein
MPQLFTVPQYVANLWALLQKLPDGEWVATPTNPGARIFSVQAKGVELFRFRRSLEPEQSAALLQLVLELRNVMPQLVIDMAKLIGVGRILSVAREISEDSRSQIDDVEFTAQLADALEAFRRAESIVPRKPDERMVDWIDRVVMRLKTMNSLLNDMKDGV